jgi:hypothetical protein
MKLSRRDVVFATTTAALSPLLSLVAPKPPSRDCGSTASNCCSFALGRCLSERRRHNSAMLTAKVEHGSAMRNLPSTQDHRSQSIAKRACRNP